MIIEQSDFEILLIKNIDRKSVYEHLLAFCNNSFYFGMAKYENPTADDYQRITVIDERAITEENRRTGRGSVIGSMRLLPAGVNNVDTIIHFVHKDASNNDPVVNPDAWRRFIQGVKKYFRSLKTDPQQLNLDQARSRGKSGRPSYEEDLWAWREVNISKRAVKDVYTEWLAKIELNPKRINLVDPDRQFKRIIVPKWGNKP